LGEKNTVMLWAMKKKCRLKRIESGEMCVLYCKIDKFCQNFGKCRPNFGHTKLGGKKNVMFWAMKKKWRLKERNQEKRVFFYCNIDYFCQKKLEIFAQISDTQNWGAKRT
jgi:hypothetical protein